MATLQYIGARYVPLLAGEWQPGIAYEALSIVTYNFNSYTSKKPVPAEVGSPNLNPEYWVQTGLYNAQLNELTNKVNNLERSNLEVYSMDAFGADPTGVEESSTALESAYAAITAGGRGGQIYFPPGHYKLTRIFKIQESNVYIVADPAAYIVGDVHDDYGGLVSIQGPYEDSNLFPVSGDSWNSIQNVGIIGGHWSALDSSTPDYMNCISVGGGVRFARIENVFVDYANRKGISLQWGVADSIISGCMVNDATNWGISIENRCYRNIISNCIVKECDNTGIWIGNNEGYNAVENCISYNNSGDGYSFTYSGYNKVVSCYALNCQRGIIISHCGGDIMNSYVENCTAGSVVINGSNTDRTPVKVIGNTIKSQVAGIQAFAVGTTEEPPHTVIDGNIIDSNGLAVAYAGVAALGDSSVVISNNNIKAATTTTYAIAISNVVDAVFSGNIIDTDKVGIFDVNPVKQHIITGNRIKAATGVNTSGAASGDMAVGNVLECTTAFAGTQPVTAGNITI